MRRMVDPLQKTLLAYVLNASGKYGRIPEVRGKIRSRILPGFFLRAEWLWNSHEMDPIELLQKIGLKFTS